MKHTMRSAFHRWLVLHEEHKRHRIPNWFRHYIRNNTDWNYIANDEHKPLHYEFEISDEQLLSLQRAEWVHD